MQDKTECMNEAKHARRGRGAGPGRISVACGNISAPGLLRKASAKTCVWWGACGNSRFFAVWMLTNIKNDARRPQKLENRRQDDKSDPKGTKSEPKGAKSEPRSEK